MKRWAISSDPRYFQPPTVRVRNSSVTELALMLYASDFYLIRPQNCFTRACGGFDDADGIFNAYKLGFEDAKKGSSNTILNKTELQG